MSQEHEARRKHQAPIVRWSMEVVQQARMLVAVAQPHADGKMIVPAMRVHALEATLTMLQQVAEGRP